MTDHTRRFFRMTADQRRRLPTPRQYARAFGQLLCSVRVSKERPGAILRMSVKSPASMSAVGYYAELSE